MTFEPHEVLHPVAVKVGKHIAKLVKVDSVQEDPNKNEVIA